MYGSHYSTAAGVVLYFLLRQEPYTALHVETQDGHFDVPDRLFSSVKQAWDMCYGSLSEVKELTPEFYYSPAFLTNHNQLPLGKTQDGTVVNDVELPLWANNDPTRFITIMREALESEHVSQYLHRWVDLIFGYKQRGPNAVKAHNVFYYLTYEGAVQLEQIQDPAMRKATELQIAHFGQCPRRLLRSPHPPRGNCVRMPRSLLLSVGSEFVQIVKRARLLLKQQKESERTQNTAENVKNVENADRNYVEVVVMTSLAEHTVASFAPGLDSLVKLGFPPLRALDALDAASEQVDDDEGHIDGEIIDTTQKGENHNTNDQVMVDPFSGEELRTDSSSSFGAFPSSASPPANKMDLNKTNKTKKTKKINQTNQTNRRVSVGSNRKYLWRTDQDPRSKFAGMSLAQSGDISRVPPFTKEHAQVHISSPLPMEGALEFVAVRCLSDRIHAVSSDGIIHSYRITRNAAPSLSTSSSNMENNSTKDSYAMEKESRIAARAAADFIPLSIQVVSPATHTPEDERLSVPVCWNIDVQKIEPNTIAASSAAATTSGTAPGTTTNNNVLLSSYLQNVQRKDGAYRLPVCWSSAGSVLACATGATGSVVLWGVDKDAGVKGTEKYCSVAVNGEASASGGHWSSVTTLSISSDTLLSGSADGMVLLWFLCRVPRSKRPAVSSRPYHLLRGHRSPVLLSAMSHAVGVAVTSSIPSEILIHRLPRPPPLGPGFEPSTEYPHTVLHLSTYAPFVVTNNNSNSNSNSNSTTHTTTTTNTTTSTTNDDTKHTVPLDIKRYVATLCVVCSTGEVIVHLHHVRHLRNQTNANLSKTMNNDLLDIQFGEKGVAPPSNDEMLDAKSPMLILMSFNINGTLHASWSGPTLRDVNPTMSVDAPLLSMEASRRSPLVIGGCSNGQIFIWHARDLVLLSCYTTGGFACHSLSLCPSEEFLAVGCDAGVMVTIALPNCRDGADPSVSIGTGGFSGRIDSVKNKVGGAARLVGKNVKDVAGSALNAGKKLFSGFWGKKKT